MGTSSARLKSSAANDMARFYTIPVAGVSFEDRQDLLGHRSGRITTHYSAAEPSRLIEAANRVCEGESGQPELVVLRGALQAGSRKTPALELPRLRSVG